MVHTVSKERGVALDRVGEQEDKGGHQGATDRSRKEVSKIEERSSTDTF